jgi:hypothetical protein
MERAITSALAEAEEDLAVARLDFPANGDHPALDAAIDARAWPDATARSYTRWPAISFLVRVRYEDHPTPDQRQLPAPVARAAPRVGPRETPGAPGETTSQAKTAAGR